jgi:acetyltransferase-like isoleucine patch superfamily enzyme
VIPVMRPIIPKNIQMSLADHRIESGSIKQGENFKIGINSKIIADEAIIGDNVQIGDNVEIVCDRLVLGNGCKIGNGTALICPDINLAEGCAVGVATQAELNEYLRLGKFSVIGNRVTISGQGMSSGSFLWLKNDVVIGGGGSQGPNSYLKIGDKVSITDRTFINLSEEVTIGDESALSYNVVLITHGALQPALMGFATKFAPIRIGNNCVVYLNSVILPGVSIGDYSTISAGSVVNKNIPAYALASGNPARVVVKGEGSYPRPLNGEEIDKLIRSVLTDYLAILGPKGVEVLNIAPGNPFIFTLRFDGKEWTAAYYGIHAEGANAGRQASDISLSYGDLPESMTGKAHFNLKELTIDGDPGVLGEDLRDYLRRRAIRIFTEKPFRTIPLSNLSRIKEKRRKPN